MTCTTRAATPVSVMRRFSVRSLLGLSAMLRLKSGLVRGDPARATLRQ